MKKNKNNKKIQMFAPFVNQKAIQNVVKTLKSGYIGEGPKVVELETKLSKLLNSRFCLAVNSGTSALHMALLAAGIKKGDEIVTTAQTMLATSQEILKVGAVPVFADIQYLTGNLDHADVAKRITKKTKAILTVDWGGYPCDYSEFKKIAQAHNLVLIEDAAHAFGAKYNGKTVGSIVPYTCFSLQAIKTLTSGDGGIVCLPDKKAYLKVRRLRWFGIDRFLRTPSLTGEPIWDVKEIGYKYHLNDISASIALGNLEDLNRLLSERIKIVNFYKENLKNISGITFFEERKDRQSANWLFNIHVEKRTDFCRALNERGIAVSVVHQRIDKNSIFREFRNDLPQLSKFDKSHICLPLHNKLSQGDLTYIVKMIQKGW